MLLLKQQVKCLLEIWLSKKYQKQFLKDGWLVVIIDSAHLLSFRYLCEKWFEINCKSFSLKFLSRYTQLIFFYHLLLHFSYNIKHFTILISKHFKKLSKRSLILFFQLPNLISQIIFDYGTTKTMKEWLKMTKFIYHFTGEWHWS